MLTTFKQLFPWENPYEKNPHTLKHIMYYLVAINMVTIHYNLCSHNRSLQQHRRSIEILEA